MKIILSLALFVVFVSSVNAQYYYRDQVVTTQTAARLQKWKNSGVRNINVKSIEATGEESEGFYSNQTINRDYTQVTTTTRSEGTTESVFTAYYNGQGQMMRTVDTSDGSYSETVYSYNPDGTLQSIMNNNRSSGGVTEKEHHYWSYGADKKPERMLRVRNGTDTTTITLIKDENGNIGEETAIRRGAKLPSVFYYYDAKNRLTDIVRYNAKAKRLLPDYVFEYNESGDLASMMIVPEGSDEYQRWMYQYDERGLRLSETCFNKRKQLVGKIEYKY
jgi:hypothetical protein